MISDTLANYISRDSSCILGLSTLELSGSLFVVSPLNTNCIYPTNLKASIDSNYSSISPFESLNEWSFESGIYSLSSNDIIKEKYISSENDWHIETSLNLSDVASSETNIKSENFSFISTISFEKDKIQSLDNILITFTNDENTEVTETISLSKGEFLLGFLDPVSNRDKAIKNKIDEITKNSFIQLFKQGADNLDGVIDCYVNLYKTNNDFFGKLVFKVYYYYGVGNEVVNYQEIKLDLDNAFIKRFIDNFSILSITLDSNTGYVYVFINNDLIETFCLAKDKIQDSVLNSPTSESTEYLKFVIGGDGTSALKMRDFFIFNKSLLTTEINFMSIINKGTLVNYEDALTIMAFEPGVTISLNKIGNGNSAGLQYRFKQFDNWKKYNHDIDITLENTGDLVQFRNLNENLAETPKNYIQFDITGAAGINGDINSLSNYDTSNSFRFYKLLHGISNNINIPDEWFALSNLKLIIDTSNSDNISFDGYINEVSINHNLDCYVREINNDVILDYPDYLLKSYLPEGLIFKGGVLSGTPTVANSGSILISVLYDELETKDIEIPFNFSENPALNNFDITSLLSGRSMDSFTDSDIGTSVLIPYTDESGKIDLTTNEAGESCIEFEVVGVNHHKSVEDGSKPTITLMSKNILRKATFNANGYNGWSGSDIRQWLNSEDEAGFLAGFSDDVKSHFATVENVTLLSIVDGSVTQTPETLTTQDKIFLPSYTEMNYGNLNNSYPEGTALSEKFTDDSSRDKGDTYWMRSPRQLGDLRQVPRWHRF